MSDYTEHLISMAGGDGEPDLDQIQARADAATEGPWKAQDCGHDCCFWVADPSDRDGQLAGFKNAADAALLAAARADVPALLAVVRSQQAKIERVEAVHYEGVAYADDIPEGGDEDVPEDYERHYCNEDGEDWPCPTIAALTATEGAA